MRPVAFVDMDGVLCSFVEAALAAHGVPPLPPREVGWGFPVQVGFSGVDDPRFWRPLGHDFWANLPWTAEGLDLLAAVEAAFGDGVALMTSPCATPGSVEGKVAWVRRELPHYARRLFVGPAKHLAAGPGKLLIDDHDANVDGFAAAGGAAVLVPRPWNRRGGEVDERGQFDVGALAEDIREARRRCAAACEVALSWSGPQPPSSC